MPVFASSFSGFFDAMAGCSVLLTFIALASFYPASRGSSWTWVLTFIPALAGALLTRELYLYSDQLPVALKLLYPLPLIAAIAAAALWSFRRRITKMSGPVISYLPFDELIVSLRADGLGSDANRLHFMIYKVAWTTGSELIGELGQAMKDIERERRNAFSDSTRARMEKAFEMVERVWPDFPR